jgi:hypothetical protein
MILVLDRDRTLNRLYPPWTRSIRELVPPELGRNSSETWEWIAAHVASVDYPVNETALPIVRKLSASASRVFVNTGRPEMAADATLKWLRNYFRADQLLMRARGDRRPTAEIKRDNLLSNVVPASHGDIIYAFDDSPRTVQMYQEEGAVAFLAPQCWTALAILARTHVNLLNHSSIPRSPPQQLISGGTGLSNSRP